MRVRKVLVTVKSGVGEKEMRRGRRDQDVDDDERGKELVR